MTGLNTFIIFSIIGLFLLLKKYLFIYIAIIVYLTYKSYKLKQKKLTSILLSCILKTIHIYILICVLLNVPLSYSLFEQIKQNLNKNYEENFDPNNHGTCGFFDAVKPNWDCTTSVSYDYVRQYKITNNSNSEEFIELVSVRSLWGFFERISQDPKELISYAFMLLKQKYTVQNQCISFLPKQFASTRVPSISTVDYCLSTRGILYKLVINHKNNKRIIIANTDISNLEKNISYKLSDDKKYAEQGLLYFTDYSTIISPDKISLKEESDNVKVKFLNTNFCKKLSDGSITKNEDIAISINDEKYKFTYSKDQDDNIHIPNAYLTEKGECVLEIELKREFLKQGPNDIFFSYAFVLKKLHQQLIVE